MYRTALLALVLLAACKRTPPPVAAASQTPTAVAHTSDARTQAAVDEVKANFSRIHFQLDSARLDSEAQAALVANARILKEYPSIRVEIQGHADERGTVDYNLALGMRRADGVERSLSSMGVEPGRVRTISYGEERPLDRTGSEVAWSQNRRCEFRVTTGTGVQGTTEG